MSSRELSRLLSTHLYPRPASAHTPPPSLAPGHHSASLLEQIPPFENIDFASFPPHPHFTMQVAPDTFGCKKLIRIVFFSRQEATEVGGETQNLSKSEWWPHPGPSVTVTHSQDSSHG